MGSVAFFFFFFLYFGYGRLWSTEYMADFKLKIIESDKSQKCEGNLIFVRNEKRNIVIVGPWKLAFWGIAKGVIGIILCVFSMLVWYGWYGIEVEYISTTLILGFYCLYLVFTRDKFNLFYNMYIIIYVIFSAQFYEFIFRRGLPLCMIGQNRKYPLGKLEGLFVCMWVLIYLFSSQNVCFQLILDGGTYVN